MIQQWQKAQDEHRETMERLRKVVGDWYDYIDLNGQPENQHLHELLGNIELIAGDLVEYTQEKVRRREENELNGQIDEESGTENLKHISIPETETIKPRIDFGISEKDLDMVELEDDKSEKYSRKTKILDLKMLRKNNMEIFDHNFTSLNISRGKSGPSTRNMSTTANLISNKESKKYITQNKFDMTGFDFGRSGFTNKTHR